MITVQGVPLTSYMETLIVNSATSNAQKVRACCCGRRVCGNIAKLGGGGENLWHTLMGITIGLSEIDFSRAAWCSMESGCSALALCL